MAQWMGSGYISISVKCATLPDYNNEIMRLLIVIVLTRAEHQPSPSLPANVNTQFILSTGRFGRFIKLSLKAVTDH